MAESVPSPCPACGHYAADLDAFDLLGADDPMREALDTPMYPWLVEYGPAKAWDEAMDLIRNALAAGDPAADDRVTAEEFALESPADIETVRAAFFVLQHAGFRIVRASQSGTVHCRACRGSYIVDPITEDDCPGVDSAR